MKIGVLTTSFPRREGDIAGAFVLGFARALAARGHAIEVLAPEPAERTGNDSAPTWDGVDVRWVPYVRPRAWSRTFYGAGAPENVASDPRAWLGVATWPIALTHAARDAARSWDAIVSHWALPGAIVGGALRGERAHLAVMHSADLHLLSRLPRPARAFVAARIAHSATAMLFVSTKHRDDFVSWLPSRAQIEATGKAHVSPMGVDAADAHGRPSAPERRTLRTELGLDRFTLLSMGRLVPVKGLIDAIDACAGLPNVELLIAGEGPERDTLVRRAATTGARVRFLGVLSGPRKRGYLAAADAFIAPSRRLASGRTEGVPHALIEAMGAGLPIITTNVGGITTLVRPNREGILVEPQDPRALAQAITNLAANKPLARKLSRAATLSAQRLDWADIAPRLEELLV